MPTNKKKYNYFKESDKKHQNSLQLDKFILYTNKKTLHNNLTSHKEKHSQQVGSAITQDWLIVKIR